MTHRKALMIPTGWDSRHLLTTDALSVPAITGLLDRGDGLKAGAAPQDLSGRTLALLFFEPSTRTALSFSLAAQRLGLTILDLRAESSSMAKGESVRDTALTVAAMGAEALVVRGSDAADLEALAGSLDARLVSAGMSVVDHPTQALLDAATMRAHCGFWEGLRVSLIGDARYVRVIQANARLLPRLGVEVCVCGPPESADALPQREGLRFDPDLTGALSGADIVMATRIHVERMDETTGALDRAGYIQAFQLNHDRLALAKPGARVMHPGPVNRDVEITGALADDPERSLILSQVDYGVFVRMALLETVLAARTQHV